MKDKIRADLKFASLNRDVLKLIRAAHACDASNIAE